ncbi:hypothetical protein AKJ16_DCAP12805 [Drosera capensis]
MTFSIRGFGTRRGSSELDTRVTIEFVGWPTRGWAKTAAAVVFVDGSDEWLDLLRRSALMCLLRGEAA